MIIIPSFAQAGSGYEVTSAPFDHDFLIINSSGRTLDVSSSPRYIMRRVVNTVAEQIAQEIDSEILEILANI